MSHHVNTIAVFHVKYALLGVIMAATSAALATCIKRLSKAEFNYTVRYSSVCLHSNRYVSEFRFCLVRWQVDYAYHLRRRTRLEFLKLLACMFVNSPVKLLVGSRTVSDVLAASAELTWARLVIYRTP